MENPGIVLLLGVVLTLGAPAADALFAAPLRASALQGYDDATGKSLQPGEAIPENKYGRRR